MISPVKIQENINGALQDLVSISDIVDFGSNSNGYYVKFANGTQWCWGDTVFAVSGSYVNRNLVFPAEFTDTSYSAAIFPQSVPSAVVYPGAHSKTSGSQMRWTFYGISEVMVSSSVTFTWLAIGRWK